MFQDQRCIDSLAVGDFRVLLFQRLTSKSGHLGRLLIYHGILFLVGV